MQSRYVLDNRNISSEEFDGEVVAVNFATGKYYGMKGSADKIWQFFVVPHSEDDAVSFVAQTFGVDEDAIGDTVRGFVRQLLDEGILCATDMRPADEQVIPVSNGSSQFEPPELEIHSDLQELILLDPVHDTDPEQGWPRAAGSHA